MADNKTIGQIVDMAMDSDTMLVEASRELTRIAIVEIHNILQYGTPSAKQQILRSFIPAMVKAGQDQGEDAEMAKLREQWAKFREEITEYKSPDDEEAVSA